MARMTLCVLHGCPLGTTVPAGDCCSLFDPSGQLLLIELVRLADVRGAHVAVSGDGWQWLERSALEEAELDVALKGSEDEEPALSLDPCRMGSAI